jgi:hypothetical protein
VLYWPTIIIAIVVVCGFAYYRGYRNLQAITRLNDRIAKEYHIVEQLGSVSYHGGLPQLPKPVALKVGLASDSLVIYTTKGASDCVGFERIRKVDRFTTRRKADLRHQSVVLWGPLAPMVFKDKIRHFMVINYLDVNNDENNILFESRSAAMCQGLYKKISDCRLAYSQQNQARKSNAIS